MKTNKPLRLIIGTETEELRDGSGFAYTRVYEILECGHWVRVKQDAFGETNATRRRCSICATLKSEPKPKDAEEE